MELQQNIGICPNVFKPPDIKAKISYLSYITGYSLAYLSGGSIRISAKPKIDIAKEILERNISNALEQAKREYENLQQQEEGGEVCV